MTKGFFVVALAGELESLETRLGSISRESYGGGRGRPAKSINMQLYCSHPTLWAPASNETY